MAVAVLAADQHRHQSDGAVHADMGRDVVQPDADPAVRGAVGRGAMHRKLVVQREGTGGQRHRHRVGIVERLHDGLAGAVDAVRETEGRVVQLARGAAAREHLHAAGLGCRIGQRDPGADLLLRLQAEIGAVLVPGGEGGRVRLLDEEGAGPDQDIGADHVLDGVEDARMADQVVEPGRVGIGMRAPLHVRFGDGRSQFGFQPLQAGEAGGDFILA